MPIGPDYNKLFHQLRLNPEIAEHKKHIDSYLRFYEGDVQFEKYAKFYLGCDSCTEECGKECEVEEEKVEEKVDTQEEATEKEVKKTKKKSSPKK